MKKLLAVVMLTLITLIVGTGTTAAQDPPLDPPPPPEENSRPEPPMSPQDRATYERLKANAEERAVRKQSRAGVFARARAAHWSYSWAVIDQNLRDTRQDRACGWSANQYCYDHTKANYFWNWSGDHYVTHEALWSQYTYCLPGCDTIDHCNAVVRTEDHNNGGRVNIVHVWYWIHRESSCTVPTWVVP